MGLFKHKSSRNDSSFTVSDTASLKGSIGKSASIYVKTIHSSPAANASMPNVALPGAPDYQTDPAGYLRSIHAVRERSQIVMNLAKKNQLQHFTVDMTKFEETAQYVVSIIKVGHEHRFRDTAEIGILLTEHPTTERLCARLCFDPSTWPLATF